MQCAACHAFIPHDAVFCHKCGTRAQEAATGLTQRLSATPNQGTSLDMPSTPHLEPSAKAGDIRCGECPKCGSHEIVPNLPILDHGHKSDYDLQLELAERPGALLFKGQRVTSTLMACICGACGYTELYATDHQQIYSLYQRSDRR
jgi:predicted nucleic-acid-binding Zn-ribbon protein